MTIRVWKERVETRRAEIEAREREQERIRCTVFPLRDSKKSRTADLLNPPIEPKAFGGYELFSFQKEALSNGSLWATKPSTPLTIESMEKAMELIMKGSKR